MATLTIEIPDDLKEIVDRETHLGQFKDTGEFVRTLIKQAIRARERAKIDARLLEGLEQIERGECVPWQPGDGQRDLAEAIARRKPVCEVSSADWTGSCEAPPSHGP